MPRKVIPLWSLPCLILALCLAACASPAATSTAAEPTATVPSQPILKTILGDFMITSTRLAGEVHDQPAPAGMQFLLLTLAQPDQKNLDPGEFSLEAFQKMIQDSAGRIHVSGKDGAPYISNMAGWVEEEFTLGFTVPVEETYTLDWPGNPPIQLQPKAE